MEFRVDMGTGYMYSYSPAHPLANKAGKVLEHVLVATTLIGRNLLKDECVHHRDREKTNNEPENLLVLPESFHMLLHAGEDSTGEELDYVNNLLVYKANGEPYYHKYKQNMTGKLLKEPTLQNCKHCGHTFTLQVVKTFCSEGCRVEARTTARRKFDPSKEELSQLVWQHPATELGKLFGVSDKAVVKRCVLLGIKRPPRGYWTAMYYTKYREEHLRE